MRLAHATVLEDFGNRSLLVHGIMVITFVNAIFLGLFVDGQLGVVSYVALLGFTAGLWVTHLIHSLGAATGDGEYTGILNELVTTDGDGIQGSDAGRFGRLLSLVGAVTALSLLTSAQVLSGAVFSVSVVAIGTVALITAIVGFFIAFGASYDDSQQRTIAEIEEYTDGVDADTQRIGDR